MTDANETKTPAQQLLVELAELHMRTHASPLPKHPGAMGWQVTTGSMAAGFARALHALMEADPAKAATVAEWFDGPFGEGPDSMEHTDWTERCIAKSPEVLERWSLEAREAAARALEAAEDWEKTERDAAVVFDAIHKHFGLSYTNYLALPRTLLQSMPDEWQTKFVNLLKEMDEAFAHVPQAEVYDVTAGTEHLVDEMTTGQLAAAGITVTGDDELGHGPDTQYSKDGEELDGQSYGFVPGTDPVPHYNRGRTRVEPRLAEPGPDSSATEVTVNCFDVEMDDGENLRALGVGNYLELDRETAGMCPGVWLLTAYHGEFSERATLQLLDREEIAALRRAEASAGMYS